MIGLYTVIFLFFKLYIYDILHVQICLLKIMGIHLNTLELHWARPCTAAASSVARQPRLRRAAWRGGGFARRESYGGVEQCGRGGYGVRKLRRRRTAGRGGCGGAEAAGRGGCCGIERHGAEAAHRRPQQAAGMQGLQRRVMREVPAHTLLGPCVVPPAAASGGVQRLLDARRPPPSPHRALEQWPLLRPRAADCRYGATG